MALSAQRAVLSAKRSHLFPRVASGATLYADALAAIGNADHGTAGRVGRAFPFSIVNGAIPVGWVEGLDVVGAGDATTKASILVEGRVREQVAVTGVTAITDVGSWVYATDDAVLTLTRAAKNIPVGIVVDWYSGTSCDVYCLSFGEMLAIWASGGVHRTMNLGVMSAGAGTGNVLTGVVLPCHGKFTDFWGIVAVDATDADVQQDVNLEIGGTNVTGGVVTWLFSDAIGAKKSGTAITAANVFHEGDLLDVETTATVAGTTADPGLLNLYAEYDILPGI